jgi:glyoxylase-like metal-dependent hydrolase (beta-lactamase superfamily II)
MPSNSKSIPFVTDYPFTYGAIETVAPSIRRIVANNPSPFTFHGTGTYIVGEGDVAVIDPGPDDADHINAILNGLGDERVSHIVVTHTHMDHSPGSRQLQERTDAKTYGFGPHGEGTIYEGEKLEEGGDFDFVPDVVIGDREKISGKGWTLEAIHTPGHCSNHLCFRLVGADTIFSGDHIMGWSTTVVIPPDGNMADYFESLEKVKNLGDSILWPTHGPSIPNAPAFIRACIAHRETREKQILRCLEEGVETVAEIVAQLYAKVDKRLHNAAGRSVWAHLIHMVETDRATSDGPPQLKSKYSKIF